MLQNLNTKYKCDGLHSNTLKIARQSDGHGKGNICQVLQKKIGHSELGKVHVTVILSFKT